MKKILEYWSVFLICIFLLIIAISPLNWLIAIMSSLNDDYGNPPSDFGIKYGFFCLICFIAEIIILIIYNLYY